MRRRRTGHRDQGDCLREAEAGHNALMTNSLVERELKFDVEPEFVVPDITALLPAGGRTESSAEQLCSDYFDTSDHALLAARITLRRRTGSTDTGWHLKIPHPPFREEIRVELTEDEVVPAELDRLLLGVSRGRELTQIASVRTERRVTRLVDAAGRRLAEIDDDTVHAAAAGTARPSAAGARSRSNSATTRPNCCTPLASGSARRAPAPRPARPNSPAPARHRAGGETGRRGNCARGTSSAPTSPSSRGDPGGDIALRRGDDSIVHKTGRDEATAQRLADLRHGLRPGPRSDVGRRAALDAALLGEVATAGTAEAAGRHARTRSTTWNSARAARVDTELRLEQAEHWQHLQEDDHRCADLALLANVDAL